MQTEKIDLTETNSFSSFFLDYVKGDEKLRDFYGATPSIENFSDQISNRTFPVGNRKTLVRALKEQYQNLETSSKVSENIESLLSEKTFTITTGHQLNIFTGPLYCVYKLITVINAADELNKKYPDAQFIPIYWMASEDHDFDEINHFHLYNKKHQWTTDQTGAVGRFNPHELKELLDQLPGDVSVFEKAYLENETLGNACRQYVNALFGSHGLVVIDADHAGLKREFAGVMESDLFEHAPNSLVREQTSRLAELGYKTQVNPREINFFYLEDDLRSRLGKTKKGFEVVDSDLKFSETEIRTLIKEHPEQFSPNVVLRPLYQEMILPNLAYVGGPSELVYWLQLKPMFDHFKTEFPLLMPRNFALVTPATEKKKWDKTGFGAKDLFQETYKLEKRWVENRASSALSYNEEAQTIAKVYNSLGEKAVATDPTLSQHLEALSKQTLNRLEKAEQKLVRAEKRKHAAALRQIEDVRNALFPNGGLQERRDNFMNFYQDDPNFIASLLEAFDPFDYQMHVLTK